MTDQQAPNTDEIVDITEKALAHVRVTCGNNVTPKSLTLRVWAASAILNSALMVGEPDKVMAMFEKQLMTLGGRG